jgi:hypothetical protein
VQVAQRRCRPHQHQAVRAVLPLDRRSAELGEEGLLARLKRDGVVRKPREGVGERYRQVALRDIDGRVRQIDDRQRTSEGRQAGGGPAL